MRLACVWCLLLAGPLFAQNEHSAPAQESKTSATEKQAADQTGETKKASPPTQEKSATKGGGQKPEPTDKKPSVEPKQTEPKRTPDKPTANTKPVAPPVIKLLDGDFAKTWKLFAAEKNAKVQDIWKVNKTETGNILVCTGKPKGYLRTAQVYGNYKLAFEFRYPMDKNGNSGVLLHIDGKDKIWPDGVQVQLHGPTAGSIFPVGNRKTRFTIGAKLELRLNKWNKCEIDVRDDAVEVRINDVAVGPLKYCEPKKGFIALQAEGSEVHFRNLVVLPYKPAPTPPAPVPPKVAEEKATNPKPADESAATVTPPKSGTGEGSNSAEVEESKTPAPTAG